MKIFLKSITGKQQEVNVEPLSTVLDVKKMVEEEYDPASLRLCYNGAVLEDAKSISDVGLNDGDSLVLAGRKRKIPKPAAPVLAPAPAKTTEAPSALASAPEPTAAQAEPAVPAESAPAPAPATESAAPLPSVLAAATPPAASDATTAAAAPPPPTAPPATSASAAATSAPVPSAPEASASNTYGTPANLIDEVCAMGFEDRNQVALALRAAFMNVDRAVEYLFDGIPPYLVEELTRSSAAPVPPHAATAPSTSATGAAAAPTSAATATAPSAASTAAAAPSTAAADSASSEAQMRLALATIPQFDEIRALYTQNKDTLPVVMQQIALRHPAVYELIVQQPEAFLAVMSDEGQPGSASGAGAGASSSAAGGATSAAHGTAGEGAEEDEGFMGQLPESLELTAADRLAVQQLVELGGGMWDEQGALLVYLATQRNQEVAASILFEHGGVPPELLTEIANQMAQEDEDYEDEQGDEQ